MFLFLDESGDLGFDFNKKGTSKFFVITVLVCNNQVTQQKIRGAIKKTISNKVNHSNQRRKLFIDELKGASASLPIKQYFYKHMSKITDWCLYSLVVNKIKFKSPNYIHSTSKLYNFLTGYLLHSMKLVVDRDLVLTIDKCKTHREITVCNEHLESIFYSITDGKYSITINHELSHDDKTLQAVDLFCNGIYKKYNDNDPDWYSCFTNRVMSEKTL